MKEGPGKKRGNMHKRDEEEEEKRRGKEATKR